MNGDDIAAFLAARLDEDEAWGNNPECGCYQDPARVLREAEAGRKLLDLYERAKSYRDRVFARPEPRSVSDEMRAVTQMMALEQVMRLRAAVYSDHPDYKLADHP